MLIVKVHFEIWKDVFPGNCGIFAIEIKMLSSQLTRKILGTCQFVIYIGSSALFNALYMHNLNQVKILNNDHEAELLKVLALMVGFQSELNTVYLDNFLSQ